MNNIKKRIDYLSKIDNDLFILNETLKDALYKKSKDFQNYCGEFFKYFEYISLITPKSKRPKYYEVDLSSFSSLTDAILVFDPIGRYVYLKHATRDKNTWTEGLYPYIAITTDNEKLVMFDMLSNLDILDKVLKDRLNKEFIKVEKILLDTIEKKLKELDLLTSDKVNNLTKELEDKEFKKFVENLSKETKSIKEDEIGDLKELIKNIFKEDKVAEEKTTYSKIFTDALKARLKETPADIKN